MESNNSGSSVAALTGAMMRPEVEVTHHWVEVTHWDCGFATGGGGEGSG